jgi:hypothetical protein
MGSKKETGQKLALLIAAVIAWFAMIKAVAKRPRPYTSSPDSHFGFLCRNRQNHIVLSGQ